MFLAKLLFFYAHNCVSACMHQSESAGWSWARFIGYLQNCGSLGWTFFHVTILAPRVSIWFRFLENLWTQEFNKTKFSILRQMKLPSSGTWRRVFDMIWSILLTAIGLTAGGSSKIRTNVSEKPAACIWRHLPWILRYQLRAELWYLSTTLYGVDTLYF